MYSPENLWMNLKNGLSILAWWDRSECWWWWRHCSHWPASVPPCPGCSGAGRVSGVLASPGHVAGCCQRGTRGAAIVMVTWHWPHCRVMSRVYRVFCSPCLLCTGCVCLRDQHRTDSRRYQQYATGRPRCRPARPAPARWDRPVWGWAGWAGLGWAAYN